MAQHSANTLPIPLNPSVLSWARKESGFPLEKVAKRLAIKRIDRVASWEEPGGDTPTMRQVQLLARLYHRPLSLFFQPKPPKLPPLAAEYRRLPHVEAGEESPELRIAVRQMSNRRDRVINLLEELGEEIPEFKLKAHLDEEPAVVADRLRKALNVSIETQTAWRDEWQAWRGWREAVEGIGVLVFQFLKVNLGEVRGISLLKFPMPVVGINSKEKVAGAKSYTLMHELIHLMLAAGQEEAPALKEKRTEKQWEGVEHFAENAASHVLVPESALKEAAGPKQRHTEWGIQDVRQLARQFRISPLAMATRLRASGYMSWSAYNSWKETWAAHLKALKPQSGGIATPAEKTINRTGRPFVQLVIEALDSNRITSVDASHYLELKFNHFDELRQTITRFNLGRSEAHD